jgi:hypothetical protein
MECSTRAFSWKACITNILRIRSYAKHAAWGAIDLAFRIHLADDLHLSILQRKAIPFPGYDPSTTLSVRRPFSVWHLCTSIASEAAGRACVWDGKSLLDRHAHIDGVDEGCLPFSIGPCLLLTRAA